MKHKHVWIVEYGTGEDWRPDYNMGSQRTHHRTEKDATHAKKNDHLGHPANLRVRKYVRAEK